MASRGVTVIYWEFDPPVLIRPFVSPFSPSPRSSTFPPSLILFRPYLPFVSPFRVSVPRDFVPFIPSDSFSFALFHSHTVASDTVRHYLRLAVCRTTVENRAALWCRSNKSHADPRQLLGHCEVRERREEATVHRCYRDGGGGEGPTYGA